MTPCLKNKLLIFQQNISDQYQYQYKSVSLLSI